MDAVPEVAWDVDPASVLSNTAPSLTEGKSTPKLPDALRRCPDPLDVVWHSESWLGKKPSQEDRFSNGRTRVRGVHYRFFGMFDGHGGSTCSEFLRKRLHKAVMQHIRQAPKRRRGVVPQPHEVVSSAMSEAFASLDEEFLEQARRMTLDDGSTALVTMLVGNDADDLTLVVANAGDCRAVLCRKGASRHSLTPSDVHVWLYDLVVAQSFCYHTCGTPQCRARCLHVLSLVEPSAASRDVALSSAPSREHTVPLSVEHAVSVPWSALRCWFCCLQASRCRCRWTTSPTAPTSGVASRRWAVQ